MTNSATAARRVAALTLIPTTVAIFGAGLAWANGHDPAVASAPESEAAGPSTDPQMALAQAKVDDARTKLAELQAEVESRNVERVAIQEQQAAAPAGTVVAPAAAGAKTGTTVTKTTTKTGTGTQPVVAKAPAAVPVQTTTKASKP
jgi:hypothetical protein